MTTKLMMKELVGIAPLRNYLVEQCTGLSYLADLDINLIGKIYSDVILQAGSPSFPAALT
jgi:hypothetical protein